MERSGNQNSYQQNKKQTIVKRELTPQEKEKNEESVIKDGVFHTLFGVFLNDKVDDKGGLMYLSWADAWAEVKKRFPAANYKVYEDPASGWNYFTDGRTAWVKVSVIIDGMEHIEFYPVTDNKNKSMLLENITSMDVNTAIQRGITKACARHGLGLSLYGAEKTDAYNSNEKGTRAKTQKASSGQAAEQKAPVIQMPPQTVPNPAQQQATPQKEVSKKAPAIDRARSFVIGFGAHSGKTLEQIYKEDANYLASLADPNAFNPQNDAEANAQIAAQYLLKHIRNAC